jgi:hypothetical protein
MTDYGDVPGVKGYLLRFILPGENVFGTVGYYWARMVPIWLATLSAQNYDGTLTYLIASILVVWLFVLFSWIMPALADWDDWRIAAYAFWVPVFMSWGYLILAFLWSLV